MIRPASRCASQRVSSGNSACAHTSRRPLRFLRAPGSSSSSIPTSTSPCGYTTAAAAAWRAFHRRPATESYGYTANKLVVGQRIRLLSTTTTVDGEQKKEKEEGGAPSRSEPSRQSDGEAVDESKDPTPKEPKALIGQTRRMLQLARPESALIGGAMGLLLGSTAISLAVPKVMGGLIDSAMQSNGAYTPMQAAGILLAMFGAQSVMLTGRTGLMAVAGERVAARLRSLAFSSMIIQNTAFFDRNRTGDLVNRLASDVLLVQGSVTTSMAQGVRNLLMVVGCTGMLTFLSPQLAVFSVAIFPPVAGIGVWFGRRMKEQQKGVQAALAGSSSIAEEVLSNIRTVRQFSAELREKQRYSDKVDTSYQMAAKVGVTDAFFQGCMHLGGHASLCGVMALGGQQVASGVLSVGDMTSFLLYSSFLAMNFGGLTGVYAQVMRALGASDRVMSIISSAETPAADESPNSANLEIAGGAQLGDKVAGQVTFKNVHFSYPTRPHSHILGGMTLEVEAGSSVAIVGASGCGKSTVLRLLTRLYDPQSGSIELDGVSLNTLEPRGLRDRIGVVEQEPVLFGGTVADNIRYGRPDASRQEVEDAAEVANARAFIEGFPEGYETQVGEGGVQMSGGQKQRIAIARAVLKDPAIMLLDEATSALDSESEHLVQAALERVTAGRTSLIVAHRLSTVRSMADKICVLNKGQVVEVGTYDELARKPDGHFKRLVQYQMLA